MHTYIYIYSLHTLYILFTYSLHTLYILFTYSLHTLCILFTYSLHTLYILFTYSLHTYIHTYTHTHIHTHTYIHTYIHIFICICICIFLYIVYVYIPAKKHMFLQYPWLQTEMFRKVRACSWFKGTPCWWMQGRSRGPASGKASMAQMGKPFKWIYCMYIYIYMVLKSIQTYHVANRFNKHI